MEEDILYESILVKILPLIRDVTDTTYIKNVVYETVNSSSIDENDKQIICKTLDNLYDINVINKYIYNSILYYEGHSVNLYLPPEKIKGKNRKPKRKESKEYFTQETEDAIIAYNKSNDYDFRSKIYGEKIHYPFFKLTENIIHTFKFYYINEDSLESLQHEIIIFLLDKIHLFNHKRNIEERIGKIIRKEFGEEYNSNFELFVGDVDKVTQEQINDFINTLDVSPLCRIKLKTLTPPKAYSYFGTIVKRYCIVYNKNSYEDQINNIAIGDLSSKLENDFIEDQDNKITPEYNAIIEHNEIEHMDDLIIQGYKYEDRLFVFIDSYVEYCTQNIYNLFPKEYDAKIADAILELFRKRDNIDIFNKKALYIYIREIIDAKTPKITKIASQLYDIFEKQYYNYLEYGKFPI